MRIRPSELFDQEAVARLITAILGREFPKDVSAYPADDLQNLAKSYPKPNSTFLVAEEDQRIVGTCGVRAEDSKTAILRRFFVEPSCRGRGIGSSLMKEALQFCRSRGFRQVLIRTADSMQQAIRICRGAGFEEEESWTLGGVTLVRFRLKLT